MGHIMNLTLYVVQEQTAGIVQEPVIFQKHAQADRYYLESVRARYSSELRKKKKEINSFQEAELYFIAQDDEKYVIRYWTLEAK